jgi:hypothetical protein
MSFCRMSWRLFAAKRRVLILIAASHSIQNFIIFCRTFFVELFLSNFFVRHIAFSNSFSFVTNLKNFSIIFSSTKATSSLSSRIFSQNLFSDFFIINKGGLELQTFSLSLLRHLYSNLQSQDQLSSVLPLCCNH